MKINYWHLLGLGLCSVSAVFSITVLYYMARFFLVMWVVLAAAK